MIIGLLLSCNKNDDEQSLTEININFESSVNLNIINTMLEISVFGYDKSLVDVGATLITRQYFNISSIPHSLSLKLTKDSYKLIMPESTKENSNFLLHIEWDSDNNGQICTGDISFNYDKKFPNVDLETNDIQNFFMRLIPSSTPCN